jgi:hypothetical protein
MNTKIKPDYCRLFIIVFLYLFVFSLNLFGLELLFHSKVPIPSDLSNISLSNIQLGSMRYDGAFLVQAGFDSFRGNIGWLIKPDGNYITYLPISSSLNRTTNIISTSQIDGQTETILEALVNQTHRINNGELLLKTATQNGFLFNEVVNVFSGKTKYKLIANKTEYIDYQEGSSNYTVITKHDGKGQFVESLNIKGITTLVNGGLVNYIESSNANKVYSAEVKDGFIYFYRVTDLDLLSSPNRITLISSQNGSFTATVNNPEQTLLNIQSSANLIDWNTFKTIKNEPSLEIVVPANKKQEFIRAIE